MSKDVTEPKKVDFLSGATHVLTSAGWVPVTSNIKGVAFDERGRVEWIEFESEGDRIRLKVANAQAFKWKDEQRARDRKPR